MDVQCYFGFLNLFEYQIGDRVNWRAGKAVQNGGRPAGGNIEGEGYLECPVCELDAYVRIIIRDDIIVGVEPDPNKEPYIKDLATERDGRWVSVATPGSARGHRLHISLPARNKKDGADPIIERLPAEQLGSNHYRLLGSPGLVEGLAFGDEIALDEAQTCGYRIIKRSGNLCIWFFFDEVGKNRGADAAQLRIDVQQIHGWMDGGGQTEADRRRSSSPCPFPPALTQWQIFSMRRAGAFREPCGCTATSMIRGRQNSLELVAVIDSAQIDLTRPFQRAPGRPRSILPPTRGCPHGTHESADGLDIGCQGSGIGTTEQRNR